MDTGVNTGTAAGTGFFDEKAVVGLSFANGAHKVYFGKSAAPIDRIGNDIGHLVNGQSVYYSMGGWRNGAFYDYSANGLAVNAAVTTKGGAFAPPVVATTEGVAGKKSSYGLSARYDATNWYLGGAWQADNDIDSNGTGVKNEWLLTAGAKFNPVTVGASYSKAKFYGDTKGQKIQAHIAGDLTPNDKLFATFGNWNKKTAGVSVEKGHKYGLGYVHSLSKRTSVFAGVARVKDSIADTSSTGWDVGMKHTF